MLAYHAQWFMQIFVTMAEGVLPVNTAAVVAAALTVMETTTWATGCPYGTCGTSGLLFCLS